MLYFPRLTQSANQYVEYCVLFHHTLVSNFSELGGVTAGAQAAKHSLAKLEEAVENLARSREKLDEAIRKNATIYIKA